MLLVHSGVIPALLFHIKIQNYIENKQPEVGYTFAAFELRLSLLQVGFISREGDICQRALS